MNSMSPLPFHGPLLIYRPAWEENLTIYRMFLGPIPDLDEDMSAMALASAALTEDEDDDLQDKDLLHEFGQLVCLFRGIYLAY